MQYISLRIYLFLLNSQNKLVVPSLIVAGAAPMWTRRRFYSAPCSGRLNYIYILFIHSFIHSTTKTLIIIIYRISLYIYYIICIYLDQTILVKYFYTIIPCIIDNHEFSYLHFGSLPGADCH